MKHESKIWGLIAAVLSLLLLFLILWFVYLDVPYVPEEEGIEVALGDYEEGGAEELTPSEAEPQLYTPVPAVQPAPSAPSSNDLMVQEDEESLALQKQAEEARKRAAAEEAERLRLQQEALALAEAERRAAEQAAAEKAAKEQAAKDKAKNLMSGAFGGNNATAGNGPTTGSTTQGSPSGNPASSGKGGPRVSLAGRDLRGKLSTPSYNVNEDGVVVVRIRVNAAGKVVSATQGQGTNTSNQQLINAAIEEAKKATFSEAPEGTPDVYGTITYDFRNK